MKTKNLKPRQTLPLGNQKGSSVLLVLVVAGLCMFLVMTSLQSQAEQSYRVFKVSRLLKQDAKALYSTLNFILNAPSGCQANFAGSTIAPTRILEVPIIYYGDGAGGAGEVFLNTSSSTKNRFGKEIVTQMSLAAHPTKFGVAGAGKHLTLLNIQFKAGRQMNIPIYVTTDGLGKILACHSTQFLDADATGVERTLEERYCTSPSTPNQTSNWKPVDCMDCLTGSDPVYYCVMCKKKGKVYDPATQTCI